MSIEIMALILLGGLFLLLVLGVEIAIAMGVMACVGFLFIINQPLEQIGWASFGMLNSFTLTAIPLFIFMGTMFANTGVVRSLFDGGEKLIGGLPGGLACATTGACAVFGAMSGSSIAATATFGAIAFPEMESKGYHHRLALGSIVAGGTLAVLIPPSVILIVYGGWENLSIVRLFAAALIPGIMLALLLLSTVIIMVKLNPALAPKPYKFTWREKLLAVRNIIPWLGIIGLVLGVIFGGIMTPTEGAGLGAFLGIAVALGYRQLTWKALKDSALTTVKVTAMVGFLIAAAKLLSFVFHAGGITETFGALIMPFGKWGALMLIYVIYIILGMLIDNISALVLTLPFVMPVILGFNFDPIWFGVIYVVLVELALVTPPFGLNLFALRGVVPKYDIMTIAFSALPFYPAMVIELALLTAFPQIALWLPSIMF